MVCYNTVFLVDCLTNSRVGPWEAQPYVDIHTNQTWWGQAWRALSGETWRGWLDVCVCVLKMCVCGITCVCGGCVCVWRMCVCGGCVHTTGWPARQRPPGLSLINLYLHVICSHLSLTPSLSLFLFPSLSFSLSLSHLMSPFILSPWERVLV